MDDGEHPLGHASGIGVVQDITWDKLPGDRAACDWALTITAERSTVTTWLNLKGKFPKTRSSERHGWNSACAVSVLMRTALQGDLRRGGSRVKVDRLALEWHAGLRKMKPADYFILESYHRPDGSCKKVRSQGLLSSVISDGKGGWSLAIKRQEASPGNLLYYPTDLLLPAKWNVNDALADALLMKPRDDESISLDRLSKLRSEGGTRAQLQAAARASLGIV